MSKNPFSTNRVSSVDRFIPRRRGVNVEASHYLLSTSASFSIDDQEEGTTKYINYACVNRSKMLYQERLREMVGPHDRKILHFSEIPQKRNNSTNAKFPLWPVSSRKQPLIGSPSLVLDIPECEANLCNNPNLKDHHIVDWGSKNYLASISDHALYIWHPQLTHPCRLICEGGVVGHCVRWNPDGINLAVSMNHTRVVVFDSIKRHVLCETKCPCNSVCTVTVIEWTSKGDLITGCCEGRLSHWNRELTLMKTVFWQHHGTIITITLSCNERYIATSGSDGIVKVMTWPTLRHLFDIKYPSPVRAVAWHPWRAPLLAVGGCSGEGSLSLWNANTTSQIGYKPSYENSFIDTLDFNSITGELVARTARDRILIAHTKQVSYYQRSPQSEYGKNSIKILANLEKEVDAIEWHTDRVLYLLWGEDGTKLGTAGADENFCIWDFLGTSTKTINFYKGHANKKNLSTNPFDNLNLFGQCIR